MSNSAWDTGSRYNKLRLSRQAPKVIHRLHEVGYIDLAPGSYSGPGAPSNRNTRIRAAEPMRKLFREAKFGPQHLLTHPEKECILLRGADKSERNVEYEDTKETVQMRSDMRAYNMLLQRTYIDVPDQESQYIERPVKTGPKAGECSRLPVCGMDNFVYRVFNRNDWKCGGRIYGGWWQGVGSEYRKRIHINDVPTVEVDYRALHLAILASQNGQELDGDPYELEEGFIEGFDAKRQRKLVKLLTLMALNAPSRKAAFSAFRDASPKGSEEKSMKNKDLERVLDAVIAAHPYLADGLCTDRGIHLMNIDSRIAAAIVTFFAKRNVVVLSIHDSFIIQYDKVNKLKLAMRLATRKFLGREVPVSHNYLGLDEVKSQTPSLVDDYIEFRTRPRCRAYLTRKRLFEERMAYLDSVGMKGLGSVGI